LLEKPHKVASEAMEKAQFLTRLIFNRFSMTAGEKIIENFLFFHVFTFQCLLLLRCNNDDVMFEMRKIVWGEEKNKKGQ
jgi:hypothetical protein